MHFGTKSYLKSIHHHTAKQAPSELKENINFSFYFYKKKT